MFKNTLMELTLKALHVYLISLTVNSAVLCWSTVCSRTSCSWWNLHGKQRSCVGDFLKAVTRQESVKQTSQILLRSKAWV